MNDAVKARGFKNSVILKPAFMMDKLLPPKVYGMFQSYRPTSNRNRHRT